MEEADGLDTCSKAEINDTPEYTLQKAAFLLFGGFFIADDFEKYLKSERQSYIIDKIRLLYYGKGE